MPRKSKTRDAIKAKNPEVSAEVLADADKYDKVKDIAIFADTEGGKILKESAMKDVLAVIYSIVNTYQTASHAELVARCATLNANINLWSVLAQSKKDAELFKRDLEQALAPSDD